VVRECRVESRQRRQLLVRLADASGELLLRFLNFYPSLQKTLAVGRRVRARGELRGGFLGREMVHPACRVVEPGTPLPSTLTPVYPSVAQLPQAYLRKAVAFGLARAPLAEILLPAGRCPAACPRCSAALPSCTTRRPAHLATLEDRSHPAWRRLKYEELLAQQLSQRQAQQARARLAAPPLPDRPGGLAHRLVAALPFPLTAAQQQVVDEIGQRPGGPSPCTGCCRATWARARRWWRRWRRHAPSTPAGNVR
jgi:ATP-dependent DNA helicase RecG